VSARPPLRGGGCPPVTVRVKPARLWRLTLTDAAPHLEHQGAIDPIHVDEPLPALQQPAEPVPAGVDEVAEESLAPTSDVFTSEPHAVGLSAEDMAPLAPPIPRRMLPEFNLGDGWTADRMTNTLHKLSDTETDRRSHALLRSLDWADA